MTITAKFRNRTANLSVGNPVTVKADESNIETIFRRLLYAYGQVVDAEKIDRNVKRYTLVAKLQYPDTLESYELETTLTVARV